MAPMLSAILGAIFLKEMPDSKTWTAIGVTLFAAIYIFYDSLQLGSIFGDLLGLLCALGLAVGAVTIRSAKNKNLVPAAVVGKLIVAIFAMFFIETYALIDMDLLIVPLMCIRDSSKTWIAIGVTFFAAIYIFYDSLQLGNIFGDLLGLICALGLAVGAVTILSLIHI